jgi:hypothetical protein
MHMMEEGQMQEAERHIPINYTCSDLLPGQVSEVVCDSFAIRIEYTITPPLPPANFEARDVPISWAYHAMDNVGTHYTECGGAYGLCPDGECTQGVLSLQPLPPPEAHSLHIVLNPEVASIPVPRQCTFDVDLIASSD